MRSGPSHEFLPHRRLADEIAAAAIAAPDCASSACRTKPIRRSRATSPRFLARSRGRCAGDHSRPWATPAAWSVPISCCSTAASSRRRSHASASRRRWRLVRRAPRLLTTGSLEAAVASARRRMRRLRAHVGPCALVRESGQRPRVLHRLFERRTQRDSTPAVCVLARGTDEGTETPSITHSPCDESAGVLLALQFDHRHGSRRRHGRLRTRRSTCASTRRSSRCCATGASRGRSNCRSAVGGVHRGRHARALVRVAVQRTPLAAAVPVRGAADDVMATLDDEDAEETASPTTAAAELS